MGKQEVLKYIILNKETQTCECRSPGVQAGLPFQNPRYRLAHEHSQLHYEIWKQKPTW